MNEATKVEKILEVLNDRISDAEQNLRSMEIGHPMESERAAYLRSLKDLKSDLIRSGLIERMY